MLHADPHELTTGSESSLSGADDHSLDVLHPSRSLGALNGLRSKPTCDDLSTKLPCYGDNLEECSCVAARTRRRRFGRTAGSSGSGPPQMSVSGAMSTSAGQATVLPSTRKPDRTWTPGKK